jgi:hypothetical protein
LLRKGVREKCGVLVGGRRGKVKVWGVRGVGVSEREKGLCRRVWRPWEGDGEVLEERVLEEGKGAVQKVWGILRGSRGVQEVWVSRGRRRECTGVTCVREGKRKNLNFEKNGCQGEREDGGAGVKARKGNRIGRQGEGEG